VTDLAAVFAGQAVLITGGLGFIGSNLARRLADLGAQVAVVDALIPTYGGRRFNLAGYEGRVMVHEADVRDAALMDGLVRGQAYLFNLAGQVSHLDSMRDPYTDLDINGRSQLVLLEACRRHNPGVRLVYSGTRQIYGRPRYLPVDEQHPVDPVDINGVNKVAAEWYHLVYHRAYGLRTTALRLTNTYGPRMRVADARQTFLGLWLRRLLEGDEILIYGDGEQRRDFTYVDDAVPVPPEQAAIDIGDYYGSYAKFHAALGWRPRVPLRDGLARTLAYYAENGGEYVGEHGNTDN